VVQAVGALGLALVAVLNAKQARVTIAHMSQVVLVMRKFIASILLF
jgi:hypothetical protein